MRQLNFLILLTLLVSSLSAQVSDSAKCPELTIASAGKQLPDNQDAIFSIKGLKKDYLKTHEVTYKWVVSEGRIQGKNGRKTVTVDVKGLHDKKITVGVYVTGLEPGCPAFANTIIEVVPVRTRVEQRVEVRPVTRSY